ncbi:MAG: efflux RND transporter periplasmic adaptor subunit, partial [Bacteroidales bacterium]|nr:efflux RND transporter periplasmic adaptor subunit [Bacteroidales bacterium]
ILLIIAAFLVYPKIKDKIKPASQPVPQAQMQTRPGQGGGGSPSTGGGMRGGQILNVSGLIITPSVIKEFINSTGTILPDEEVELSFETSGKIVAIYFSEGTRISKGDLLAKINDRHLQAQLLKLEAQRRLAQDKEFRQKSLLERDAISRESYDQIVTELEALDADILLVRARIMETELRAPFDGIIGLRYFSEGSYATTSTKIARLVKVKPLKLEFSINERYAGEIKPGFPITFQIDGILDPFPAKVYALDPKVDMTTRTFTVRAIYPNTNEELKPGRFARINLQLSEVDNAISIPTEALIPEMDGEKVFLFRSGKAMPVKVTTGLRTESVIQITSGLSFGDTIITSGILQLRQSLPVVLDKVEVQNQR